MTDSNNRRMLLWRFVNSDIGRLLIGFLLTTVAGTFLVSWHSYQQWHREKDFELIQLENDMAVAHVNEVNAMLQNRLDRLRELYAAGVSGTARDTQAKLTAYRDSMADWKIALMFKSSIIDRLYAGDMRHRLYTSGNNEEPPVTVSGYFDKADRAVFAMLECSSAYPCGATATQQKQAYMAMLQLELGLTMFNSDLEVARMSRARRFLEDTTFSLRR